ncbi:MAG: phosphoserine phosphatase [Chlamydiales bacterium]|jgi:phosphoserine phosphatase
MSSAPHPAGSPDVKAGPPYTTVIFDCDSTLSSIEGIEDLAVGHEAEVRALTDRAMSGELPIEAVYGARLDAIQPTAIQVAQLGQRYLDTLLPNVRELVAALIHLKKRVCIVSGGLLPPVREMGTQLGVADSNIHAVGIRFDPQGNYAGFDENAAAARAGGKLEILERLATPGEALALVGDGATDLEAAPACARFIGFGGVVQRPAIMDAADARCSTPDFAALAPLLLSEDEIGQLERSTTHRPLALAVRALPPTP